MEKMMLKFNICTQSKTGKFINKKIIDTSRCIYKESERFYFLISNPLNLFLIDINKYMKPQFSQALTAPSAFQSKKLS